ncbi:hypothetical protein Kfla_0012 [Kribbella flavida DSM 17836]|uniref:DUF3566 domain-containing protein n=1 Tax=Kribbella flavida (strain DSM 17836 / JCM 10339 / NBRC 14399) TaxID=479435 RepID=D2PQF6_KRIFD|nr:DUF3566 domain-containing protein [Kribbella flavida]ADB29143.1 hypothetical protein Kfla_0012 [Kribbella flavida DSM 17836]
MTNRARPNWPDGTGSAKSPRPPQGGNGKAPATPPATPASNGRANGSPPRPGTPGGQQPADRRPSQQRPAAAGQAAAPASVKGKPARPPQQPPVRPATQTPVAPSTPGRPEPRPAAPSAPGAVGAVGASAATPEYGQTAKVSTPAGKQGESFGDKMNAAKQAVLEKAAAVKDAAADKARPVDTPEPAPRARGQVRKARLRLSRIDPWSVMKTAFLLSIAFGIVTWVAVFIVWSAIGAAGVFENINNTVSEVLGTPTAEPFRIENYINTGKVMGFTTLLACADVLIITALATLGSFLYNVAATLLGGLEVTLASED